MLLKYTHPADMGYNVKIPYELDEVKQKLSIDMIKVLFTPIDFKWSDLDKSKKKTKNDIEVTATE
jgi:hypothetical protein